MFIIINNPPTSNNNRRWLELLKLILKAVSIVGFIVYSYINSWSDNLVDQKANQEYVHLVHKLKAKAGQ